MKINQVPLTKIQFVRHPYSLELYQSLVRIGLNFPIQVEVTAHGYLCIDGHKRLSAIEDILKEDFNNKRFQSIQVISIKARTQSPYSLHNHH